MSLIAGAALLVLAVCGGLVWLSHAAFLRVAAIEVTGTQSVPTSTLAAYARAQMEGGYAYLFARDNIFLYPRAQIAADLERQYPTLRQVDVHAKDFHTVEIIVAERTPAALWCPAANQGGTCYYMDEEGLVYERAPDFNDNPYISYGGPLATTTEPGLRQYLTRDEFQSLAALVSALGEKEQGDPIGQVAVDDNRDVRVYFKNDFLLIFSLKDDGGDVFERFNLALQSDAFKGKTLGDFEYLDLRFGDKLYYKAKSQ